MILLLTMEIEMDNQQLKHQEIFKPYPKSPKYLIGSKGTILSAKTKKPMRLQLTKDGYFRVGIVTNGKSKKTLVHRLVAKTYIRDPEEFEVVNHKDGVKTNNVVENLEWTTVKGNNEHAFRIGLNTNVGERNPKSFLKEDDVLIIYDKLLLGKSIQALSLEYGVSKSTIADIKHKRNWVTVTKDKPDIPTETRRTKLSPSDRELITKLKGQGLTNREIKIKTDLLGHDFGWYQIKDFKV